MVQQTKDLTFTEYGLAHAESGLLNSDKQLSVSIAAKKSELQYSCNENLMMVSNPIESPHLMKNSECTGGVKISGTKRPVPECTQSLKSNAGNAHIVYVRRKPETDAKISFCDTQSDAVNCSHLSKSTDQDEATQQPKEIDEPIICTTDTAPLQRASSPSFSSTRSSVSPPLEKCSNILSPENIQQPHLNSANPSSENTRAVHVKLWEERYCRLQSFLKMLDQSDQYEYVQMLQSLSSVERSRHAVELENRSIKLSLEEAKEMQRVKSLDMLGTDEKKMCTTTAAAAASTQQKQSQVQVKDN